MRILLILCSLFSVTAFANWDSVAVFHRPEKVVVLINEHNSSSKNRLKNFISLFENGGSVRFESSDLGIKISCGGDTLAHGCTFRFTPGSNTEIREKGVIAFLPLNEMADFRKDLELKDFEISFLNSNGDEFHLWIENEIVFFSGAKK